MSVLKNFKNTPRSPPHRATGPKCNFFLQIRNEVPSKKKRGMSPTPGATVPTPGATGAVARWGGQQGLSPLYKPWPPYAAIPFVI